MPLFNTLIAAPAQVAPPTQAANLPSAPTASVSKSSVLPVQRYEAAVPKKKATPVLPASAAFLFPKTGTIEVIIRVHIDETGHVTGAYAVSQGSVPALNHQLEDAAVAAAKEWIFDPARSNSQPISSDRDISFVFQHGVVR